MHSQQYLGVVGFNVTHGESRDIMTSDDGKLTPNLMRVSLRHFRTP